MSDPFFPIIIKAYGSVNTSRGPTIPGTKGSAQELIPTNPAILLSFINLKLRDFYPDLEELCASEDISRETLEKTLAAIGYQYDPERNQFV